MYIDVTMVSLLVLYIFNIDHLEATRIKRENTSINERNDTFSRG